MMNFVVKKEIMIFLKEKKVRVSDSLYIKLNLEIEKILNNAIERMKKNGRSTIMEQDI